MWEKVLEIAKSDRPTIALGLAGGVSPAVKKTLAKVEKDVDGVDIEIMEEIPEAVTALRANDIDGFVRGDLNQMEVRIEIEKQFGIRLIRVPLLRFGDRYFFIGPLRISGRESVKDRLEMAEKVMQLIRRLGQKLKVGVLSWEQEHLGEGPDTDAVITEATYLIHHIRSKGIQVRNYAYLVNRAVEDDCNLIITPNSLATNLIGTSLYLGGAEYMATPAMFDHVYIEPSGSLKEQTYLSSMIFAIALANLRKKATMIRGEGT